MRRRIRGVAVLACTAVVGAIGITAAAVASAAENAPAADALLSRNQPVTASSSGSCCAPKNAVDGNASTRWASAAGKDPSWVYVDLGAVAQVHRVRLQWDKSCATAYQLPTSTDPPTWTTLFPAPTGEAGGRSPDADHVITVRARDAAGNVSPDSPPVTVHTEKGGGTGNPYGDSNMVSMFNGTNLNGWTPHAAGAWSVQNGAIHGNGTSRGWIYYNTQFGTFRWIFNVRQVDGNHAPTVLIWGTTNPIRDALSGIQV